MFQGVATVLGKSRVKDESGKDLYLNAIDIDSDKVFTRLARVANSSKSNDGKDVYLVDKLCKSTYATKTKKRFGYHIYWFSHEQNKPIRTKDCRLGCEFEIKTDNSSHLTLPPSRYRDYPDFHYKSVGQNAIFLNDKLYKVFIDLLSDFIREKPAMPCTHNINQPFESVNGITSEESSQIALILASAYRSGSRNDIIFVLSGFLLHRGFVQNAAEAIVKDICKLTNDEEVENRLVVVRNTYNKANDGKPIIGRNGLLETLERVIGIESANQIINDISEVLNNKQDQMLSQLDSNIRDELSGHIFETISYDPPTLVVAHAIKKQILTCKIKKPENIRYGDVIINAVPEKIVRYVSPLNTSQIKHKIVFTTSVGESFTTLPKTTKEIVSELHMRGLTYKPRIAEESLNAVINGAQRAHKVTNVRRIETPGFYFFDGKITASDITIKQPSTGEIRKCAEFLNDLIGRSKHPEVLVTEIKWGILAPFNFVFKQLSDNGRERWMPWLYLNGYTQTSKTTDGRIALGIYRKHTKLSLASTNYVARLGKAISHDTFPILIDEVKLDPKIHSDLIEATKHAVQGQIARTRLTKESEEIHISALSACILTSNHQLPADPALCRRFLNYYYPKDDKPSKNEIDNFESFLESSWETLGVLGEFATAHLLSNQELITNDSNDWKSIAKAVLDELYKAVNLSLPAWIDWFAPGNQIEDVEAEEEQITRSFLKKRINDTFARNYRTLESLEDQKTDKSYNKYKLLVSRLNFCLDHQLIPFMRRKNTNPEEILITSDILKELSDTGINFVQSFIDLSRMLGAEMYQPRLTEKQLDP